MSFFSTELPDALPISLKRISPTTRIYFKEDPEKEQEEPDIFGLRTQVNEDFNLRIEERNWGMEGGDWVYSVACRPDDVAAIGELLVEKAFYEIYAPKRRVTLKAPLILVNPAPEDLPATEAGSSVSD